MAGQSKRTKAPAPMEFPRPTAQLVPPPTAQLVPPPAMFGPGAWLPPRPPESMAASSPPCWIAGLQPPGMAGSSAQGLFWRPSVGIGGSAFAEPTAENLEDYDLQAWGLDSHQPGGFLNLINNTSSHTQAMNNGSSSQPINDGNENNGGDPSPSPTMSDSSPYSDDSDELAPSKIMEVYVAEQTVLDSIAERLMTKIKAKLTAGLSHGRSGPRKRIRRDHGGAHERLVEDYFAEEPLYPESMFRTRFRMNKHLFLRIVNALGQWSPYFTYREDCAGRIGLSPLQKCTAAMRMLAYGTPADALDEYLKIGKCTALECLDKFARGVIEVFGEEYLRRPNREDVERLLQVNESRGFPGMLGSIDCMHWRWEKCPLAWRGQFTRGDYGVPTMVLEVVASQDLRIWHAFFGIAGSNNDLNVLNQSPLFFDALKGEAPQVQFSVNGNEYNTGYYLADGIYPEWAAFMKTIPLPQTEKHKLFAKHQEGARKDVERAFGVLQSRFTIVRRPARLWQRKSVGRIMKACVILHNMIVEDEREQATIHIDLNEVPGASFALPPEVNVGGNLCFADVLRRKATIRARPQHTQLKNDLVEHIWHRFQNNRRN